MTITCGSEGTAVPTSACIVSMGHPCVVSMGHHGYGQIPAKPGLRRAAPPRKTSFRKPPRAGDHARRSYPSRPKDRRHPRRKSPNTDPVGAPAAATPRERWRMFPFPADQVLRQSSEARRHARPWQTPWRADDRHCVNTSDQIRMCAMSNARKTSATGIQSSEQDRGRRHCAFATNSSYLSIWRNLRGVLTAPNPVPPKGPSAPL